MAGVRLDNVTKRFGGTEVIRSIDLDIADGELLVFVGPSGCGKSTILRLIAGLEEVTSGTIWIGGKDVTHLPPARRGVSMVFQSYALYPHMDAYKNIAFGLQMSGTGGETVDQRVRRVADMLQIGGLLHRKPRELSGGQRQRVAIARAIVREPQVFLFDEPLSNLDAALRAQTRLEIARLHDELKATMIYVTHDQLEAMTLADRIVLLNAGRIEQAGQPTELYRRPATRFAAEFIGSPKMNIVPVQVEAGEAILPSGDRLQVATQRGGPADLGVRPENIALTRAGEPNALSARVLHVEELGESRIIHAALRNGTALAVRHPADSPTPRKGEEIALRPDPDRLHLFNRDGLRML
ncbi:MAG: sn-glycerol-3-phosphate ABC transporter ATP-binding protein UgpC [Hyphomicrobiaceae bacterium]|nr:sn-glycerol-3-phosphate ABC transporter ATP-binding protein UgpC [Hyphomicrobiaceae bacterium]